MAKTKVIIPHDIATEYKNYYEYGFGSPARYMHFHKELAEERLEMLADALNIEVVSKEFKGDGWFTSMKVVYANIKLCPTRTIRIHWHPANQEFFMEMPSGGSSPLSFDVGSNGRNYENIDENLNTVSF